MKENGPNLKRCLHVCSFLGALGGTGHDCFHMVATDCRNKFQKIRNLTLNNYNLFFTIVPFLKGHHSKIKLNSHVYRARLLFIEMNSTLINIPLADLNGLNDIQQPSLVTCATSIWTFSHRFCRFSANCSNTKRRTLSNQNG